ncbi:bifunctional nicotinamidase/pyrazinamidase [Desulfonauticus submarinus]
MKALLLIDIQNDFCQNGALPVPKGDEVVPVANALMNKFNLVVATQDWHPKGHISFASTHNKNPGDIIYINGIMQILWPDHCIQNSKGADFHPHLNRQKITEVVYKGTDPLIDSYSGFFDNAKQKQTKLDDFLKKHNIKKIFLVGLATDYCVKFTALDGVDLGYETYVIIDGCRAVNINPQDEEKAIQEMKARGVKIITREQI